MRTLKILCTGVAILLMLSGCDEFFNLDKEPQNMISGAAIFKDKILTEAYIAQIYDTIPWHYGVNNSPANMILIEGMGAVARCYAYWQTPAAFPLEVIDENGSGAIDYWPYNNIRYANEFIINLQESDFEQEFIDHRVAEARFLRAYMYFQMVIRFGGVPIITIPQDVDASAEELNVPRDSEKAVYDFIASEMDAIVPILDEDTEPGRVNSYTALALKSKAMLFAASVGEFDGSTELNGLLGIPSGEAASYWQASLDASNDIIGSGKYSLYNKIAGDPAENYAQLFIDESNPERIFVEEYDPAMGKGQSWGIGAVPFEFRQTWGSNFCPFLNIIDEYEYIDGSPGKLDRDLIDSDHLFDIDSVFRNRDPRFVATFFFPESDWQGGKVYFHRRTVVGLDTLTSGKVDGEWPAAAGKRNWTNTGFLTRKRMDESEVGPLRETSDEDYMVFRYGEILLNYAEAAFYLGQTTEALDKLNMIRERAGIPLLGTITEEDIRHERTVELAFEENRYWDLRRWRIAHEILDGLRTKGLEYTYYYNEDKYDFIIKNGDPSSRIFQDRHYYLPLGVSRIADNPKLVENPGY
ncbi:MAG: RagB/SusD family nutrient uptake outer membrane protein [Bacteroidales bacterium]|nr:RagB/SusD family nutrient uptake outer membrane protein [Bacteroidales bacterium]